VVTGGRDSASADLVAGWLAEALGCPVRRVRAASGAGLLSVRLERASGVVELARPEGGTAVLTWPGRPAQRVTLTARRDAECLAEELARLDGDEVYERALTAGRR
jgi:glucose-6-phosphate dehydrogenase assembly protein OpcA